MRSTHLAGVRDGDNAVSQGCRLHAYGKTISGEPFPYVYGFSFRAKRWGRMAIKGLSEIALGGQIVLIS